MGKRGLQKILQVRCNNKNDFTIEIHLWKQTLFTFLVLSSINGCFYEDYALHGAPDQVEVMVAF